MYPEIPTDSSVSTTTFHHLHPGEFSQYRDCCYFMDIYGTIWYLQPSADPGMPLAILCLEKKPVGML